MAATRLAYLLLPAIVALAYLPAMVSASCQGVSTANGIRTLRSGQYACASANWNNTDSAAGQYYHVCYGKQLVTRNCARGLVFDVKYNICNWPSVASCEVADPTPMALPTTTTPPPPTCNPETCKLPDCFCYGDVPAVDPNAIPQFIMLTFDDAITSYMFRSVYFDLLINPNFQNPNKCPAKATFFVSHNHTDYNLVQFLYNLGHEMASHGINHTSHETTFSDVADEIVGQRKMISEMTTIPEDEIQGFRSPYLDIYGNVQFEVLSHYNMTWDSSITNVEIFKGKSPLWPFTLDFTIEKDNCPMGECPDEKHPGVWEIPMNGWIGDNGYPCGMIDGCSISGQNFTGSTEDYYNFFMANFNTFYKEKVPMHMFTHASMFMKSPNSISGLKKFMSHVLTEFNNVWFVSPSQVVEWMKNPVTNDYLLMGDDRFSC